MGNVQLKKLFGKTAEQRQRAKVVEGLRAIGAVKRETLFWIDEVVICLSGHCVMMVVIVS